MNIKKRTNLRFIMAILFLSSFIFGLGALKTAAIENSTNQSFNLIKDEEKYDDVTVLPVESTVKTNMLNVDSAVVTEVKVEKLYGKNQELKVTFANPPKISEKLFAVLVDEVYNENGGIIDTQYLDENNSVVFEHVPEHIKIPGIHLYKQVPTDPQFAIIKDNFIASTSYLMPYGKVDDAGYAEQCEALDGDGNNTGGVGYLFTTTIPCIYSLDIPNGALNYIESAKGVKPEDVLAAVICNDVGDDGKKRLIEIRQWVSMVYEGDSGNFCKFQFLVPDTTKNFEVHLYKKALLKENFLCKFRHIDI